MATAPQFASTPAFGGGIVLTASTVTTGTPSNPVTIFTAGSNGSRIDEIDICGLATNLANIIRLYMLNAGAYSLIKEFQIPATTASATASAYQQTLYFNNLFLPSGYSLVATVTVTEGTGFRLTAFGGDF